MNIDPDTLSRAQGCLLGQLAGDALGSLVEFQSPEQIRRKYPKGVRELANGGTWGPRTPVPLGLKHSLKNSWNSGASDCKTDALHVRCVPVRKAIRYQFFRGGTGRTKLSERSKSANRCSSSVRKISARS